LTSLQQSGRRVGAQKPRLDLVPKAKVSSAGLDAIELAAIAGLHLDEWQQNVLLGSLGEVREGKWAAFEVGLIVPRQNGKGSVLEARELAGLFLFGEELIIHSAHEFKTAAEAFNRILGLVQNTPDLDAQVAKVNTGHGNEAIELKNGNRLKFLARSAGSGRGFSASCIILDEAYALKSSEMAAMLPTMAAKSLDGNPQIWYTSSAGMPHSEVLAGVRARGMDPASKRLAYFEWSTEDSTPITSVAGWYQANPGLGIRMSKEHVQSELEALDEDEFKRERLGIWEKLGGESFIPEPRWASCRDGVVAEMVTNGEVVEQKLSRVALGVDVPPDRSSASVCVAGVREDGSLFVELIMRQEGTDWVAPALRRLLDERGKVPIVADGLSAVASLALDFRQERVRVLYPTRDLYRKSCGLFYDKVMQQAIRHQGQPDLDAAVKVAQPSSATEKLWAWTGGKSGVDVSPLVAATLAVHGSLNLPNKSESAKRRSVFA
jgi:hypothetical protein